MCYSGEAVQPLPWLRFSLYSALAAAPVCLRFDAECCGALIMVWGCNYSLEGPHLARDMPSKEKEGSEGKGRECTKKAGEINE